MSACVSEARTETNGSIATRSSAGVPKSTSPLDPNPGTITGAISAAPSAVNARRRAPRPAVAATPRVPDRPDGSPPLHAREPVREHDQEGGREERHPVERLHELFQHGVGEGHERHGGHEAEERAPRAERQRVRREDGGPEGDQRGQEQRVDRLRGRGLDPRLLPDERGRVERRSERVGGGEAVPGGLREDDQPDRDDEAQRRSPPSPGAGSCARTRPRGRRPRRRRRRGAAWAWPRGRHGRTPARS